MWYREPFSGFVIRITLAAMLMIAAEIVNMTAHDCDKSWRLFRRLAAPRASMKRHRASAVPDGRPEADVRCRYDVAATSDMASGNDEPCCSRDDAGYQYVFGLASTISISLILVSSMSWHFFCWLMRACGRIAAYNEIPPRPSGLRQIAHRIKLASPKTLRIRSLSTIASSPPIHRRSPSWPGNRRRAGHDRSAPLFISLVSFVSSHRAIRRNGRLPAKGHRP